MDPERLRRGRNTIASGVVFALVCGAASAISDWHGFQYGVLIGAGFVLIGLYVIVAPPSRRKRRERWQAGDGPVPPDRRTGS
jgi:hypothetical protein